jgi:hypothetical protein
MRLPAILALAGGIICAAALGAYQMPFREYPGQEYSNFPLPSDYKQPSEFVFARLMYPDGRRRGEGFGPGRFGRGDWREGYTNWTNDYPRSDRHLMVAFRRLTRIDSRSVEQPVNLDDGDDVYNWPFLYAGRVIAWNFSDQQNAKLRDFLARGGFLICDDIWGDSEWEGFMEGFMRLFPDRQVEDLAENDPAFHTVYDLDERFRYQILGQWGIRSGRPLNGGVTPHWRGVYDEQRRLAMAVWVNNDTGDSWEWADDPTYPERYSALGFRIMINHVTYAMTH